jgi:hypothetical protein
VKVARTSTRRCTSEAQSGAWYFILDSLVGAEEGDSGGDERGGVEEGGQTTCLSRLGFLVGVAFSHLDS